MTWRAPTRVLLALLAAGCAARSSAAPERPTAGRRERPAAITSADRWRCIDDPAAALRAAPGCGVTPGDSIGILRTLIADPRFLRADPYEWTAPGPTIAQMAGGDDWIFVAEVPPDSSAIDDKGAMAALLGDSVPRPIAFARRRIATDRARIGVLSWARRYPTWAAWSEAARSLGVEALGAGALLACSSARTPGDDARWSLQLARGDERIVVTARIVGQARREPVAMLIETLRAPRERWETPATDSTWTYHADARSCREALDRLLIPPPTS